MLYSIYSNYDEVLDVDSTCRKQVVLPRLCKRCGYFLNGKRVEPFNVHLAQDTPPPHGPLWTLRACGGAIAIRCDLLPHLRLGDSGYSLGAVFRNGRVLDNYKVVVLHHSRWIAGVSTQTSEVRSCLDCNRLLTNAPVDGWLAVKESIRHQFSAYCLQGTRFVISAECKSNIPNAIQGDLNYDAVPIVRLRDATYLLE